MQDFDTSKILEDDKVEITDLDPHNDGSSTSDLQNDVPALLFPWCYWGLYEKYLS